MSRFVRYSLSLLILFVYGAPASAEMRISEWMYSGLGDEFVEFTNLGGSPIDMTGWSYDDDSRLPGEFDLSGFGVVQPGESVVITEDAAPVFRFSWSIPDTVKILGQYPNNLGRADEINLYDASNMLVDRLTYGDQDFPGSPRTTEFSGNPATPAALGANDPTQWVLASVGDGYGSYMSLEGDVGNPGFYVPEPAISVMLLGVAVLLFRRR